MYLTFQCYSITNIYVFNFPVLLDHKHLCIWLPVTVDHTNLNKSNLNIKHWKAEKNKATNSTYKPSYYVAYLCLNEINISFVIIPGTETNILTTGLVIPSGTNTDYLTTLPVISPGTYTDYLTTLPVISPGTNTDFLITGLVIPSGTDNVAVNTVLSCWWYSHMLTPRHWRLSTW
jgi:hypothetical protein